MKLFCIYMIILFLLLYVLTALHAVKDPECKKPETVKTIDYSIFNAHEF